MELIKIRGMYVKIDKGCVSLVKLFNNKGLNTQFCCEGHKPEDKFYVIFENYVEDTIIINFIELHSKKYNFTPFLGGFYKWYRKVDKDIISNWIYMADTKEDADEDYQKMINYR
jgi:hypothetical protein